MNASNGRRAFLRRAATISLAAPFVSRFSRAFSAEPPFDPAFSTASQAMRAIRTGVISCRELTEHTFARIAKFNPTINAFVTLAESRRWRGQRKQSTRKFVFVETFVGGTGKFKGIRGQVRGSGERAPGAKTLTQQSSGDYWLEE